MHHPVPRPPATGPGVLEERDVRTGRAVLVRVEEVVDRRVVLVDGLLDEPQPEDVRIELDVPGRVPRDARDVVDPLEPHRRRPMFRGARLIRVAVAHVRSFAQLCLQRQGYNCTCNQIVSRSSPRSSSPRGGACCGSTRRSSTSSTGSSRRRTHCRSRTTRCSSTSTRAPSRQLRMSELASSVLLSQSGLTRLVDRLERSGLVVRRALSRRPPRAARLDHAGRAGAPRGSTADASGRDPGALPRAPRRDRARRRLPQPGRTSGRASRTERQNRGCSGVVIGQSFAVKIGIVVPFSWSFWGAVVEHAELQAAALEARGHEVKLVMGNDPPGQFTRVAPPPGRPPRRARPPT